MSLNYQETTQKKIKFLWEQIVCLKQMDGESNVQSDWNETDTASDAYILNKPTIPATSTDEKVKATSGDTAGYLDSKVDNVTIEIASNKLQVVSGVYAAEAHTHVVADVTDFDAEVAAHAAVVLNTAKVTNALHTGEMLGDGVLSADPTLISNKPVAVPVAGDTFMFWDNTDSLLKQADLSLLLSAGPIPTRLDDLDDVDTAVVTDGFALIANGSEYEGRYLNADDSVVDASGFIGNLSGTDVNVQTALNTLDGITFPDKHIANSNLSLDAARTLSLNGFDFEIAQSGTAPTTKLRITSGGVMEIEGLNNDMTNNSKSYRIWPGETASSNRVYITSTGDKGLIHQGNGVTPSWYSEDRTGTVTREIAFADDTTGTYVATVPAKTGTFAFLDDIAGGSAHIIEDEGVSLTARAKLNFVGSGVTVTDDAGDDASVVTITASAITSVNTYTGVVVLDPDDLDDTSTTNKWNVSHTGDVAGATALTIQPSAITGKTLVTAAAGDMLIIWDDTDSTLKRVSASDFLSGGSASQLSDLSDVNTSTPTNRNILVADGTDWESRALVEADISDLGTYLTANQTITLSGDVTGSGTTAITTTISAGAVDIAMLSATGTPSATTFLRGDNTWATPAGGGASELSDLTDVNTSIPTNKNFLIADGVDWESRAANADDIVVNATGFSGLLSGTDTDVQTALDTLDAATLSALWDQGGDGTSIMMPNAGSPNTAVGGYGFVIGANNTFNNTYGIMGGYNNSNSAASVASIIVGEGITTADTDFSAIFGRSHTISAGANSLTIGGHDHTVTAGDFSTVLGYQNTVSGSGYNHVIGTVSYATSYEGIAMGSYALSSAPNTFAGGRGFNATNRTTSSAQDAFTWQRVGSALGDIGAGALASLVIGGKDHDILLGASYSGIVAGDGNDLGALALRSVILGGSGQSLNSPDTVMLPTLNLSAALANDDALTEILVKAVDGTIKYRSAASLGGGHTIEEATVALTARAALNFEGPGFSITDNSGTDATDVSFVIQKDEIRGWVDMTTQNTWYFATNQNNLDGPVFSTAGASGDPDTTDPDVDINGTSYDWGFPIYEDKTLHQIVISGYTRHAMTVHLGVVQREYTWSGTNEGIASSPSDSSIVNEKIDMSTASNGDWFSHTIDIDTEVLKGTKLLPMFNCDSRGTTSLYQLHLTFIYK